MSPRPASSETVAVGLIAGELAATAAGAAPPEWIKVTPRGAAKTRDGRGYAFDPETLAARFKADAVDVALDLDHAIALRASKGERVDAIGYARDLQARADGTYARVDWLDGGSAALAARTHRYVSPTFHHDAAGNATWLHSISLVSAPALSMPALAHALGYPENPMKQIAKALGLPETADEAACLAALGGRAETAPIARALGLPETSDAAACLAAIGTVRSGGGDMVATLQATLTKTSEDLASLRKDVRAKEVDGLLDCALKDRKIVPAQREHLAGLCATDDGLKGVRAMLAATVPHLRASGLDGEQPETGSDDQDPATLAAAAQRIQDDRAASGQPIGFAEAVALAEQASKKKA